MPGTTLLTRSDIAYRIDQAGATAAVTDPDGVAKVDEAAADSPTLTTRIMRRPLRRRRAEGAGRHGPTGRGRLGSGHPPPSRPAPDDPMLLYFTSGTVAYPKMVLHTQASLGIGHQITGRLWLERPSDLHWTVSDFGWAKAAWGKLFGQWAVGPPPTSSGTSAASPTSSCPSPGRRPRVTTFCAPPTIYRALFQLETSAATTGPGCATASRRGEPLNPEVIETWRRRPGCRSATATGRPRP